MDPPGFPDHLQHLNSIRQAAMRAADAGAAVRSHLSLRGNQLILGQRTLEAAPEGAILLIALGKAASAMAQAAAQALGERITAGLVTLPQQAAQGAVPPRLPASVRLIQAQHPLPGPGSLRAGQLAAELLQGRAPQDLVLALISGGGSALMELPAPGIELEHLRQLNRLLLACGAPIQSINQVRKAVSRIKAGGLVRLAAPAGVVGLILSDVVGDRLGSVASGPTVLARPAPSEARGVMQRHGIWEQAPASVRRALSQAGRPPGRARRPVNVLVGSNRQVLQAARQRAADLGFQTRILTRSMQGEAREVGARFSQRLRAAPPGSCLLMGGETTVEVRGSGLGGRNQELALAAALRLEGAAAMAVMSFGTDGVDGPTDAAGAIVTGQTAASMRSRGFDPAEALSNNNAYPALDAAGALLRTGPTGTNLNDVVVGLRYERSGAA